MRIYNGMKFSTAKYVQHFCGQTQEFFEHFQFNHRDQAFGKSIDEYLSVLWNMAKNCGFCDCMRDLLIMDHFLLGISDMRKSCSLLIYFWTKQLKSFKHWKLLPITWRPGSVRKLRRSRIYWRRQKSCLDKHQYETKKSPQGDDQKSLKKKPLFCLQIHVLKKERRPAWGKTCAACGERNPFKASGRCEHQVVNSHVDDYSSGSSERSSGTISTITAHED